MQNLISTSVRAVRKMRVGSTKFRELQRSGDVYGKRAAKFSTLTARSQRTGDTGQFLLSGEEQV
jgi:hypothetical protein